MDHPSIWRSNQPKSYRATAGLYLFQRLIYGLIKWRLCTPYRFHLIHLFLLQRQMLTDNPDVIFMRFALHGAEKAFAYDEVPVGAVVVSRNRIIARAHNQTERLRDNTAHAEMLALTAAEETLGSKILESCTLYVTLEPCVMCAGACYWTRVGRIVVAATDPKMGFLRFGPALLHPRTEYVYGVEAEAAAQLLRDYFQAKRN